MPLASPGCSFTICAGLPCGEWSALAAQLDRTFRAAEAERASAEENALRDPKNAILSATLVQAGLAELTAAKAYNDFLETGSTAYKLAQDIASRLKSGGGRMVAQERHALQIELFVLDALAQEFDKFVHGRACAQPQDHARLDKLHRACSSFAFKI